MKKGQASLEFLSTYAWAFMAMIVTLGALYYFGFLNIGSLSKDTCLFPPQFACNDFTVREDVVRFQLINNLGEDVSMTSLAVDTLDGSPLDCDTASNPNPLPSPGTPYLWPFSNATDFVISCTPDLYAEGENYEFVVSFTYFASNSPSQRQHVMRGKLIGTVI